MYLFKTQNGFVCGKTSDSDCPPGLYRVEPSQDRSSIQILFAGTDILKYEAKVTEIQKADDSYYANFAELKAAYEGFFFRVGGSASFSNGYLIFPNVDTGFNMRLGNRAGFPFAVDRELTATGFAGTEDVDWENLGGFGPA